MTISVYVCQGTYEYRLEPAIDTVAFFPSKSRFEGGIVAWRNDDSNAPVERQASSGGGHSSGSINSVLTYAVKQVSRPA